MTDGPEPEGGWQPLAPQSPREAIALGCCPQCLGSGETFNIVLGCLGVCSLCGGTGALADVWTCPHGLRVGDPPDMTRCPLGFPGCHCADALVEGGERWQEVTDYWRTANRYEEGPQAMSLDRKRDDFASECRTLIESLTNVVDALYELRTATGAEVAQAREVYCMLVSDLPSELDHVSTLARREEMTVSDATDDDEGPI